MRVARAWMFLEMLESGSARLSARPASGDGLARAADGVEEVEVVVVVDKEGAT
jgi:flavin-binding protein dodecin